MEGLPPFPVAAKVVSGQAVHKSDVGGVALGVKDAAELGETVTDMKRRFGPLGEGKGVTLPSDGSARRGDYRSAACAIPLRPGRDGGVGPASSSRC